MLIDNVLKKAGRRKEAVDGRAEFLSEVPTKETLAITAARDLINLSLDKKAAAVNLSFSFRTPALEEMERNERKRERDRKVITGEAQRNLVKISYHGGSSASTRNGLGKDNLGILSEDSLSRDLNGRKDRRSLAGERTGREFVSRESSY